MKRFEQKYILDSININNVLREIHARPSYGSRKINSVYYDTKNLDLYKDSLEGTVPRKKVRFRWYDNENNFYTNSCDGSIEIKHTFAFHREKETIKVLDFSREKVNKECNKYFIKACFPISQVSFFRQYFEAPNDVRITIDKSIKFFGLNEKKHISFSLYPKDVFEIKMSLQNDVSKIQSMLGDKNSRFSKYCLSIENLNKVSLNI